jgi:hypothetical protein
LTKKELYHICRANGIPPLLYEWSFTKEFEDGKIKKILSSLFDEIDSFIRGRNVWYVCFNNSAISSKIGASFFKIAILEGYYNTRYTTIENLAGYRRENWYEDGDVYNNILTSDFLVIDKISHKMEEFQRKIWNKFVEDRLLMKRSTIFVGLVEHNKQGVFDNRAVDLLKDVDVKILTDKGVIPVVRE